MLLNTQLPTLVLRRLAVCSAFAFFLQRRWLYVSAKNTNCPGPRAQLRFRTVEYLNGFHQKNEVQVRHSLPAMANQPADGNYADKGQLCTLKMPRSKKN